MKRICKNCNYWEEIHLGYTPENIVGYCDLLKRKRKAGQKCNRYAFPKNKVVYIHDQNSRDKELPST